MRKLFIVSMFVAAALGGCMTDEESTTTPAPVALTAEADAVALDGAAAAAALTGAAQLGSGCFTCDFTGAQFCGINPQHAFNRCMKACMECITFPDGNRECFQGSCTLD